MQINKQEFLKVLEKLQLLPVVPYTGYVNTPYISWSLESNWLTDINTVQELLEGNYTYNGTNNNTGKTITITSKNVTGFGLLTGTRSNIVVIDLDVNHKENVNGIVNFNNYLEENNIPFSVKDTFTVQTTGGGLHLYYKYTGEIKGTVGIIPGVDIRAQGNQIPLPYSKRRVTQEDEETIKQYTILHNKPILELPQELVEFCTTSNSTDTTTGTGTKLDLISIWNNGIPQGERNNKLLQVAGRLRPSFSRLEDFAICMIALNSTICEPPLSTEELDNICTYVWNKHINNSSNNYPFPYYYDERNCAIYKKETNEEEEEGEEATPKPPTLIYKGYINLVGRRINIDTNEKGYVLESKDLQDYNKLILDGEQLFGSNAERDIKNIFARTKGFVNFPVGQGSTKPVLKLLYAQDIHKRTNNLMVDTYYTNRLGWVSYNNNKLFSYPSKEIVLDSVECNIEGNTVANTISVKGTTQEWIDNVLKLLISSNNGKVMLLGSFAAPLVNLLDIHENSIIQLEGATSTGKTHCLEACASVYGNEKYVKQWNSTPYAINVVFSSFGSFPIIFDDLKNISNKVKSELGNICYGFVQGESKLQGKAEGGLRETMYFSSLLLTSSEYPITEELKQHEGATARVLVLPGSFLPVTEQNRTIVNKLDVNSKKYYGAIGLDWCKYLVQLKNNNKVEELKDLYETYRDILQAQTTNNIVSRKCNTIALLQVTGHILEDFLNKDYFNIDQTITTLMKQIEESTKEADTNTNAFMEVIEKCLGLVKEGNISLYGEVIGIRNTNLNVKNNIFGDCIVLKPKGLNKILEDLGYNASTIKRAWGKLGYLANIDGQTTHSNIKGLRGSRGNILLLSEYKELTGQNIIEVPTENLSPRNRFAPATNEDIF